MFDFALVDTFVVDKVVEEDNLQELAFLEDKASSWEVVAVGKVVAEDSLVEVGILVVAEERILEAGIEAAFLEDTESPWEVVVMGRVVAEDNLVEEGMEVGLDTSSVKKLCVRVN